MILGLVVLMILTLGGLAMLAYATMSGRAPARAQPRARTAWKHFAEVARADGTDRSALIRNFIDWYLRHPDAKAPKRP